MNCRKVNHLLSAYMDGELPGVEYRQIREHILRCPDCSGEYEALLRMKRLLAQMRLREPQNDLATRILRQVHQAEESRTAKRLRHTGVWWQLTLPAPSRFALALTLLFAAGFALAHLNQTGEIVQWRQAGPADMSALSTPIDLLNPTHREPMNFMAPMPVQGSRNLPQRQFYNVSFPDADSFHSMAPVAEESFPFFAPRH